MGVDKIHVTCRGVLLRNGQLLLCRTNDLEKNFYFLPGGHVEHGESVTDTIAREFEEETGVKCNADRMLGVLEYGFVPGHSSICHNHEYSFIFEIAVPDDVALDEIESQESNLDLEWVSLDQIQEIDFRAEPLKELLPKWLEDETGISHGFGSEMSFQL